MKLTKTEIIMVLTTAMILSGHLVTAILTWASYGVYHVVKYAFSKND